MPDVNLLKNTEGLPGEKKKPLPIGQPELTSPATQAGAGLGGVFKSFFNRAPRPLPTSPAMPAKPTLGKMTLRKSGIGDRILSETKRSAPSMIPLPEDDDSGYNVNLLSEDLVGDTEPRRRFIQLGLVAAGAILLIGLGYLGLYFYQRNIEQHISSTKEQLATVEADIRQLSATQQEAAATAQKLSAIKSLIDRHTRWTKFFSLLEKYTLPSVSYGPAFTGDLNGSLSLSATASTYEQVAQQYLIFKQLSESKTFISNFSITGATQSAKDNTTQVNFVVTMTLVPAVFIMTADEAQQALAPFSGSL